MKEINFYNKERNLVMQFTNFCFDRSLSNTTLVSFDGKVDIEFFHLKTNFEAELFDFEELSSSLRRIYDGKGKFANFNPLSPKILIRFEMKDGYIMVKGEISNDMTTCNFEFEYEIDQSFLPELIKEIEVAMIENN